MSYRYTDNDLKLSQYILEKSLNNKKLPFMTIIRDETGVSASTISRYAKRKGFYSFAEMRASFNKQLEKAVFDDYGLSAAVIGAPGVAILSSKFTEVIGAHIANRLHSLNINVKIINDASDLKEGDIIIATTLSFSSTRLAKLIKENKNNCMYLICGKEIDLNNNLVKLVSPESFTFDTDALYDRYKKLREMYIWVDDILNIIHLKMKRK